MQCITAKLVLLRIQDISKGTELDFEIPFLVHSFIPTFNLSVHSFQILLNARQISNAFIVM